VLDDVERRALAENPARKGALPALIGAAHVELEERAGQLVLLPRRGLLAGAQPDDRVADAKRLPGLHRQLARLAVALVEQADDRDSLGHRRTARRGGCRDVGNDRSGGSRFGRGLGRRRGRRGGAKSTASHADPPAHADRGDQRHPGQPA